MKKTLFIMAIGIISLSFFSCKKEKIETYTTNVSGYMKLFDRMSFDYIDAQDEDYYKDLDNLFDFSGIKVVLSQNGNIIYETETEKSGKFLLKDVQSGVYRVQYIKDGYSTFTIEGYPIAANSNNKGEVVIVHELNYLVMRRNDFYTETKNTKFYVKDSSLYFYSEFDSKYLVYFLLSTDRNISDTTCLDSYWVRNSTEKTFTLDYIHKYFYFEPGDTIYAKVYTVRRQHSLILDNSILVSPSVLSDFKNNGYRTEYGVCDGKQELLYAVVPKE